MSITLGKGLLEEAETAVRKMLTERASTARFNYGESTYLVTALNEVEGTYYGSFELEEKTYSVYLLPAAIEPTV